MMEASASGGALEVLRGRLVVSCQASPGSPLRDSRIIAALARAAELGGAAGLRIEGLGDVDAVRAATRLPLIGLVKVQRPDTEVYITPTVDLVGELCRRGAEIVAFDATARPRPASVRALVEAAHAGGRLAMADISTAEEAAEAVAQGADIVGTTLAGYTAHSSLATDGPDVRLQETLARAGIPFIAEGRIGSPAEAAASLARGAFAVVVGTAITRPEVVTSWYVEALARAAATRIEHPGEQTA